MHQNWRSAAVKLDDVRRSEEELETAYQFAQDFRMMVTQRQEGVLGGSAEKMAAGPRIVMMPSRSRALRYSSFKRATDARCAR